jgi:hypothetical protein
MAFLSISAACGNHNVQLVAPKQNVETLISFLEDGQTTMSEVMSRLGKTNTRKSGDDRDLIFILDKNNRIAVMSSPVEKQEWKSEDGRILIFILDKKYRIVSSADKARFHLVLVFDESDRRILKKHSLVRIR